jgi:hypothetical protein
MTTPKKATDTDTAIATANPPVISGDFKYVQILPDPDDWDAPDDTPLVEGLADAPGSLYWANQHLMVKGGEDNDAAELWLFSKILRVDGKQLSPIDIDSAPWFTDVGYAACLAHVQTTLNKWMSAGEILGSINTDGSILKFDDGLEVIAVTVAREDIRKIAKMFAKDATNGLKYGVTEVFRFRKNGEVTRIPRSTFPKWDGTEASGGREDFTWQTWCLLVSFFFKKYYSRFQVK